MQENIGHENFLAVDTLKVDDHLRLRFSKRTRNIFPIRQGDELAIFQNRLNDAIILNLQREGRVAEVYQLRRISNEDHYDYQNSQPGNQSNFKMQIDSPSLEEQYQIPSGLNRNNYRPVDVVDGRSDIQKLTGSGNTSYPSAYGDKKSPFSLKQKRLVMIVDDESDILMSFATTLEQHNIESETFTNSYDALLCFTEAATTYYGLIILDIKMPGLNGLQLYKLMRAQKKDIEFLFVSALDYATELMQMVPGINGKNILTKPVSGDILLRRVCEMLYKGSQLGLART
jgi:CheY-like chemotaxis protein